MLFRSTPGFDQLTPRRVLCTRQRAALGPKGRGSPWKSCPPGALKVPILGLAPSFKSWASCSRPPKAPSLPKGHRLKGFASPSQCARPFRHRAKNPLARQPSVGKPAKGPIECKKFILYKYAKKK
mgnify:FL=1